MEQALKRVKGETGHTSSAGAYSKATASRN